MEASSCKGMESAYCSGEECFSDCSENGNNVYEEASNDSTTYTVDVAIIGKIIIKSTKRVSNCMVSFITIRL